MTESVISVRSPVPELDEARWYELMILLSLDVVRPFFEMSGLFVTDPDALQRLLRRLWVNGRKKYAQSAGRVTKFQPAAIAEAVSDELGPIVVERLIWWERNIFSGDPRDGMLLSKWDSALHCCRASEYVARLNFLGPLQAEVLDYFLQTCRLPAFQHLKGQIDSRRLSDWDLHMYALHLYDDNLYTGARTLAGTDGPWQRMEPTISNYEKYAFWRWMLGALSPEQIDRLWRLAKELGTEEGLRFAVDLPHPSVLNII